MADTWYAICRTPAPSIDVWPVGDMSDMVLAQAYVDAILALLSYPADWFNTDGWDLSLSPGTPHPSLLAQATVHDSPPAV